MSECLETSRTHPNDNDSCNYLHVDVNLNQKNERFILASDVYTNLYTYVQNMIMWLKKETENQTT